ncbi:MAG: DUF4129 domain-containing protein [Chryseolinea sp.]
MKYGTTLFLCVFLLFSLRFANAQDSVSTQAEEYTEEESDDVHQTLNPKDLTTTKEYESDDITLRKFDNDRWKKVVGSTDYDETHSKKTRGNTGSNSKERKGKRFWEKDHDDEDDDANGGFSFNIGPFGGLLIKLIFYGAVITIIGLILYNIIKDTSLKPRVRRVGVVEQDFTNHVEDIADLNIDELLAKALASGNYRLTIRIYFLGLLKKLNASGFIIWKKDKTNRDYLTELYSKPEYFGEVRKLTIAYEQVWYGDHSLSSGLFQELSDEFKAIDQKLETGKIN